MALRIHTIDGKVRDYNTHYSTGGDENTPSWFETNCGMKWYECPSPHQTCNHINCAIYVAERNVAGAIVGIFFSLLAVGIFPGIWSFLIAVLVIIFIVMMLGSKVKEVLELYEFKKKRTINGKTAYIDSPPSLTQGSEK